jgi:23S rRNA (pseudouridine1915-N3)-methyltransferase
MGAAIRIIIVGRESACVSSVVQRYIALTRPWCACSVECIRPHQSGDAHEIMAREEKAIRAKIPAGAHVVVCAEDGRSMDSPQFARWVDGQRSGGKDIRLIIGGAHGLSAGLKTRFETLSLSPLTFPHRLALEVLVEQLYRAFTILYYHPYHK